MTARAPLSVIIPTLNAASDLPRALAALAGAAIGGLVREVIVVDGGSADATCEIAEAAGARVIVTAPGRGGQLGAGAGAARGEWFLFLHADTVLAQDWGDEASRFIAGDRRRAGVFTLAFDAQGLAPRLVATGAMIRTRFLGTPYGDQGLLVSRDHYVAAGGFRAMPLMEDVDFVDRLRRHGKIRVLKSRATTSARRYERDGYLARVAKNFCCILMHRLGVAPEKIAAFYE